MPHLHDDDLEDQPRARKRRAADAFRQLDVLLLDAGNTVVFLDLDAVAAVARGEGVEADPGRLAEVEGAAKRRYEALLANEGGSHEAGWRLYLETLLTQAGVPESRARELVGPLRAEHDRLNLWRRVPKELPGALAEARLLGLRVGIVSNSEGKLEALFAHVGLADAFEVVVDSAHEGVRKPDPEIFARALARMGVTADRALYAGDLPSVDVLGAMAAGLHAALIDPLDFYPEHRASPRFASVAALVDAIGVARSKDGGPSTGGPIEGSDR